MKSIIKTIYPYVIVFALSLASILLFNVRSADTVWNYGMAHAIRMGEVPFRDFNIIAMPLYPLIMSLGLFVKDSYLVYMLEQALCCTLLFYFAKKMLDKKTILYFLIICFPFFNILLPNYNFLAFLLIVIIMYCEKKEVDDKYIGILLGLLFLTKHTIGLAVIFLTLIGLFNIKKSLKRLLFSLIPIFIFIIYLLFTHSLYDCINLCFLGLFDFGKSNNGFSIVYLLISILILIYNGYLFYKDKKNINKYYLLSSFSFIVPILNMDHCVFLIGIFALIFLEKININKKINIISFVLLILLFIFNITINSTYYYKSFDNGLNTFHARFMSSEDSEYIRRVLKEYKKYKKVYMISMDSMLYDIESGKKINYFGVPLYGNYGYDGINNLEKSIIKNHGYYYFIQDSKNPQFITEILEFVKEKGKFIKKCGEYDIYYIK